MPFCRKLSTFSNEISLSVHQLKFFGIIMELMPTNLNFTLIYWKNGNIQKTGHNFLSPAIKIMSHIPNCSQGKGLSDAWLC
jgi:hypothetical protein